MKIIAGIGGGVLVIAIAVAVIIFGTNIVVWNVQDIWDKGANFWNIFWILLVLGAVCGGSARVTQ